ncbi:MAG: M1 family metallopeptidase [Conexivisphaerales archaeon]
MINVGQMSDARYLVELRIDYESEKYIGKEVIETGGLDGLELDAVGMKIESVMVDGRQANYVHDGKKLYITGKIENNVEVNFSNSVSSNLMGFYVARYNGGKVFTTHFEPNGARYFIPCVDKPAYKARYKLIVYVDADLEVISNMPQIGSERNGKVKMVEFMETPAMSSYLLYLGVGPFDFIADRFDGRELYVAAYSNRSRRGKLALEVAINAIGFYEHYFGIKFALPKMHLIAVPEFAMGAMENWGAITFRETALLADESSAELTKRSVAVTIAHELAHQWFGDLVTMKWWDDLWLNESFATFMSYKAIESMHPEWDHWNDFVLSETSPALLMDSISSTHPIHVDVKSEDDIEQIFDDISYGKGASVLRMLESYMGSERFMQGIRSYLKKYSFSNATMQDLWMSLEESSGLPISRIMKEWVTLPGHPVIYIEEDKQRLSQKRFLFKGSENGVWPVPLTYYHGDITESELLETEFGSIKRATKLNANGSGFYRVQYWDWNEPLLKSKNAFDRWNVVSDLYAMLISGNLELSKYLDLINGYYDDSGYLPVWEVSTQLTQILSIDPSAISSQFIEFHRRQLNQWRQRDSPTAKVLVGTLSRRLVLAYDLYGKSYAKYDFFATEPDLKSTVALAKAIYSGNPFDELHQIYTIAKNDEDRSRIIAGMVNIREREGLKEALKMLLSDKVKKQDIRAITASTTNYHNRDIIWSWLTENYGTLRKIYSGSGVLPRIISYIVPYIGLGREAEVMNFFKSNPTPEASMGISVGIELMEIYSGLSRRLRSSSASL